MRYGFIDIKGQKFGRLRAIKYLGWVKYSKVWLCKCDCGEKRNVESRKLRNGIVISCGCFHLERVTEASTKHGLSRSNEYSIWRGMFDRCTNSRKKGFENYGGKGITVCNRWKKFENFYGDMGPRPSKKHSIDRKNGKRGYSKNNCRWATPLEQMCHTRRNRFLTYEGKTLHLAEWARLIGISKSTLYYRWKQGWPVEKVLQLGA
jgi:hypothetical protein